MNTHLSLMALVRKEIIQALRDTRIMGLLIVAPVIQTIIFGYATNLEFNHANTVVVDQDHTDESRSFVEGLSADGTFTISIVTTVPEAEKAIQDGRASVGVIIPRGFAGDLQPGVTARVQVLVDGSDSTRANSGSSAVEQYVAQRAALVAKSRESGTSIFSVPVVSLESRLLYNPGMKSSIFMVPGTAASILLIVTTVITAMGLARERETGTMEQLLVTPISPMTLMLGKTIPYAMFGILDIGLILIAGNWLFGVPLRGGLDIVFLSSLCYLTATLGTGLLISTIVRTQQQALTGGFFFVIPAILLSGFMTPVDSMPSWIRSVTYLNPVRYYIEIVRSVLLRRATLEDVQRPLLLLTGLSVGVIVLASLRFRRTIG